MRRLLVLASLAIVVTTLAPSAAVAASSRQQPCSQAWALLAQEQSGLDANDLSAWGRVNDAFLSMTDASFDGPLSNALGNVSAAAEVITIALQSDDANDPSKVDFNAALGALGTVCAQLTVTTHKDTVAKFQKFTYQTGVLTGLEAKSAARANATVAVTVKRAVQAARRSGGGSCMGAAKACGYFVQVLKKDPCVAGIVCMRSQVGLLPVGANDSQGSVTTMPFDAFTGGTVPLSRFVPEEEQELFLARLDDAVQARLTKGGLGDDPAWQAKLTIGDVRSWLPEPNGIHVWFDKYAVAPGSFGIVHVVVPWG